MPWQFAGSGIAGSVSWTCKINPMEVLWHCHGGACHCHGTAMDHLAACDARSVQVYNIQSWRSVACNLGGLQCSIFGGLWCSSLWGLQHGHRQGGIYIYIYIYMYTYIYIYIYAFQIPSTCPSPKKHKCFARQIWWEALAAATYSHKVWEWLAEISFPINMCGLMQLFLMVVSVLESFTFFYVWNKVP